MSDQVLWAIVAQTAVIVGGVVVLILHSNARFDAINKRIDDLRSEIDNRFKAIDKRIDDLRSEMNVRFEDLQGLLRSEIKRLEDRIDRITQQPASRQN